MRLAPRLALLALLWFLPACDGTTGSGLVRFTAMARAVPDADLTQPFETGSGFRVQLTRARMHVAAIYLNQSVPTSGAQESACVLPGIYVAQAFGPIDLDLLSSDVVPFASPGEGTATHAATAEVWLAGGPIDEPDDRAVILDVAGAAEKAGQSWGFSAQVTIGQNRALPVQNPATPGANPICHQRIVTPIAVDLMPEDGGQLVMQIDPRGMWNGVDFASLAPEDRILDAPPVYRIPDENGGVGGALYKGLVANAGVYTFTWNPMEGARP